MDAVSRVEYEATKIVTKLVSAHDMISKGLSQLKSPENKGKTALKSLIHKPLSVIRHANRVSA